MGIDIGRCDVMPGTQPEVSRSSVNGHIEKLERGADSDVGRPEVDRLLLRGCGADAERSLPPGEGGSCSADGFKLERAFLCFLFDGGRCCQGGGQETENESR